MVFSGDNVVLGSCGFQGDVTTLNKVIEAQLKVLIHYVTSSTFISTLFQIYDHIYQKKMRCVENLNLVVKSL